MGPPVVRFVTAYAAGLWVGLLFSPPFVPVLLAGGACLALAAITAVGPWRALLCATVCIGVLLGSERAIARSRWCAVVWAPGDHAAVVRVGDAPGRSGFTRGRIVDAPEACGGEVRLLAESVELEAGQTVVAVGRYRGKGLFRVDHARGLERRRPLRFTIRHAVAGRIEALFGSRAPMVEAMVLGRRDDVDREMRSTFVAAGLAHLLAISGLHVGILAGWVALAAGRFMSAPRVAVVSAVSTWLYVAILGFPAPATRAAAFISIGSASRLLQRRPPVLSVLAVAVLVVLTVDAASAASVGAWLSVAAVWGTGSASRLVPKNARYLALGRLLAGSAGATLWTAPITAYAFGSVAPIGILANLPAIPLAAAVVPAVFLSLVFGETLAGAAGLGLAGIETIGTLASRIPGGHL